MNQNFEEIFAKSTSDILGVKQVDHKKLAELIVQECASLIYKHAESLDTYKFTDKANTAKTCGGMLLEHFGLKEKK